jgi:hypothetical protein
MDCITQQLEPNDFVLLKLVKYLFFGADQKWGLIVITQDF